LRISSSGVVFGMTISLSIGDYSHYLSWPFTCGQ